MRGITIIGGGNSLHTGNDLGLVQEIKEIGKPAVQTYTVQVPGRNGLLNLTKGLTGRVMYNNRPLRFQYCGDGSHPHLLDLDALMSRYHGQTVRIIDDDYPEHYYEGEAAVSTVFGYGYLTITLSVNALPFRYKRERTVVTEEIKGDKTLVLGNEGMESIPTITVSGELTVTLNGITAVLSAGTYEDPRFMLYGGENTVQVSGTGTITFNWQEGAI